MVKKLIILSYELYNYKHIKIDICNIQRYNKNTFVMNLLAEYKHIKYVNSVKVNNFYNIIEGYNYTLCNVKLSDFKCISWNELWTPDHLINVYLGKEIYEPVIFKFKTQAHLDISKILFVDKILIIHCMKYMTRRIKLNNKDEKLKEVTSYKISKIKNGVLTSEIFLPIKFQTWYRKKEDQIILVDKLSSMLIKRI